MLIWTGTVSISIDASDDSALMELALGQLQGFGVNRGLSPVNGSLAVADFSGCQ